MHRDSTGREIRVGDYICYSAMRSQSCKLKFGKVLATPVRKPFYSDKEVPTLRVSTAMESHHWKNGKFIENEWHLQKDGKSVTLDKLENVLVIPASILPAPLLTLLEGVKTND